MQRKKKLIKKILQWAEGMEDMEGMTKLPEFNDYSDIEVRYHVLLCLQAGFLEGREIGSNGSRFSIRFLTWAGHEYLEQASGHVGPTA